MEQREVEVYDLTVCDNGHLVDATPTGEMATQIKCWYCHNWTWQDGNYCVNCGKKMR